MIATEKLTDKGMWEMRCSSEQGPCVLSLTIGTSSRYTEDPEDPSREILECLRDRIDDISLLILPPCSAETLQVIYNKNSYIKQIFVADNDKSRLYVWQKSVDLSGIPVTILSAGDNSIELERELKKGLYNYKVDMNLGKSCIYIPRRFKRIDPEFSKLLENMVLRIQQEAITFAAHQLTSSWHTTLNNLINAGYSNAKEFDVEKSIVKNAVIVGAGPSLDLNVHKLKTYRNRCIIIATDGSFNTLLENGIKPDILVSQEDTYLSWRFVVSHLEDISDIPLCIPFDGNYAIYNDYPGEKVVVNSGGNSSFMRDIRNTLPQMKCGQCVGHMAFHIASYLNAENIIMIGFDLGFRNDKFHPDSMAVKYVDDSPDTFIYLDVEGVEGKTIKTDLSMNIYRKYFEDKIYSCKSRVIDSTEGGALIHGTDILPLEEVLADSSSGENSVAFKDNVEFNKIDCSSYLMKIGAEISEIASQVERESQRADMIKPENFRNPLSDLDTGSEAFNIITSCSNIMLFSSYAEAVTSYSSDKFDYTVSLMKQVLNEVLESCSFISTFLKLKITDFSCFDSVLVLVPEEINDEIEEIIAELKKKKVVTISSESVLTEVWKEVLSSKIGKIVTFNGKILPEMWHIPGIKCYDIKVSFDPHFYERSLWIPDYNLLCTNGDIFEKWNEFVPKDVNCQLLKDQL